MTDAELAAAEGVPEATIRSRRFREAHRGSCADCGAPVQEVSTYCRSCAAKRFNPMKKGGQPRTERRCEDCHVPVGTYRNFCDACVRKHHDEAARKYRVAKRAEKPAEAADLEAWIPPKPLMTRPLVYEPEPLSTALCAQALEQAVAQCAKIGGVARLEAVIAGSVLALRPHEQRVRDAVAAYRESGGSPDGLERAVQAGLRAAGDTFRLPNVAGITPEEDMTAELLGFGRHQRHRLVS